MKTISTSIIGIALSGLCYCQPAINNLKCQTLGTPDGSQTQFNMVGYDINNSPVEYNGCFGIPAIMIVVIDTATCLPWTTCDNSFGQANIFTLDPGFTCNSPVVSGTGTCRQRPENYFIFRLNDSLQVSSMINFLNVIPDGNYVLIYTWYTYAYNSVSPSIIQAMGNLVSTPITIPDNIPFILFCQKGPGNTMQHVIGSTIHDTLMLTTTFECSHTSGISELLRSEFQVYPNPVYNSFNIQSNKFTGCQKYQYRLLDVLGNVLFSGEINQQTRQIDVSFLPCGSYNLNLVGSDGTRENHILLKSDY